MQNFKSTIKKILLEGFTPPDELFVMIESELRDNARKLGINLDESVVVNTNRVLKSPNDIADQSSNKRQWAGYGTTWFDWVRAAMPEWLSSKFYVLNIDYSKIIRINSKESLEQFSNKWILNPETPKDKAIKYDELYKSGYHGVDFKPYNRSWAKYGEITEWYRSVDMDSIVIINKAAIKNTKLLLDATELIRDYSSREEF